MHYLPPARLTGGRAAKTACGGRAPLPLTYGPGLGSGSGSGSVSESESRKKPPLPGRSIRYRYRPRQRFRSLSQWQWGRAPARVQSWGWSDAMLPDHCATGRRQRWRESSHEGTVQEQVYVSGGRIGDGASAVRAAADALSLIRPTRFSLYWTYFWAVRPFPEATAQPTGRGQSPTPRVRGPANIGPVCRTRPTPTRRTGPRTPDDVSCRVRSRPLVRLG
jgi:hypothetical protein